MQTWLHTVGNTDACIPIGISQRWSMMMMEAFRFAFSVKPTLNNFSNLFSELLRWYSDLKQVESQLPHLLNRWKSKQSVILPSNSHWKQKCSSNPAARDWEIRMFTMLCAGAHGKWDLPSGKTRPLWSTGTATLGQKKIKKFFSFALRRGAFPLENIQYTHSTCFTCSLRHTIFCLLWLSNVWHLWQEQFQKDTIF